MSRQGSFSPVKNDGYIKFYKKGIFKSKWTQVYFVLYSDSTFKWFKEAKDEKSLGSLFLKDVISNICIGKQIDKIPSKKPPIHEKWDTMLLIAIPENENAKNVSWFYFSSLASITKWLNEIICTLPKLHRKLFESIEDDYETNISFKKPKYPAVKSYGTPKARGTSRKHSENDSYPLNQMLHLYGFGNLFLPTQNYGFDDSVYCYDGHHHDGNKIDPHCYNEDNNVKHCLDQNHNNIDGYHNSGSDTNNANHNNHDYSAISSDTSHHTSTHFNNHSSHNFHGGISHGFGSSGAGHSSHGGGFSSHDYSSGGCDFSGGGGDGGCGGGF